MTNSADEHWNQHWKKLSPEERSSVIDENAENSILQDSGASALDESLMIWGRRCSKLVEDGSGALLAVTTCYRGFLLEDARLRALYTFNGLSDFEYPSSRRIISVDEAAKRSLVRVMEVTDSRLQRLVFLGAVYSDDDYPPEVREWAYSVTFEGRLAGGFRSEE